MRKYGSSHGLYQENPSMKYKRLKEMLRGLNMQKYLLIPPTTAVFRFAEMATEEGFLTVI